MAAGKINLQKASGGITVITGVDGVNNTEVVLPESGTVATTASVKAEISTGSNLITSQTGAIGYGTGAGGIVTQLTSKYTAVTLNKPCGRIIMNNGSLVAGATALFQVNNNLVVTTDNISVIAVDNANYEVTLGWNTNLAFTIRVKNVTAGVLSESLNIQFLVCKGVAV